MSFKYFVLHLLTLLLSIESTAAAQNCADLFKAGNSGTSIKAIGDVDGGTSPIISISRTWERFSPKAPKNAKKDVSKIVRIVNDTFAIVRADSFFRVPPNLEIEVNESSREFHYQPRKLIVGLKRRSSNNGLPSEKGALYTPAKYSDNFHEYGVEETRASIAHEVGHGIFEETAKSFSPSIANAVTLNLEYMGLKRERDAWVSKLKPPKDHTQLTPEQWADIRNERQEKIIPKIEGYDRLLSTVEGKLRALTFLKDIIHPYQELFGDLIAYAYTGSESEILKTFALPGQEPLDSDKLRLFSNSIAINGWIETGSYEILAPTRSWIGRNMIGDLRKVDTRVLHVVLEASIKEIQTRAENAQLHVLSPEEINRRLIGQIEALLAPRRN